MFRIILFLILSHFTVASYRIINIPLNYLSDILTNVTNILAENQ